MKPKLLLVAVTALVGTAAVAQLRVTSFNSSGDLTWTNSVANAVYRLQWATNPAGPWNSFSTQTNLNSIQAHSNRVTVNVPILPADGAQFLRLGWRDAPPYAGLYDLREYDTNGILLVTGSLWMAGERGTPTFEGTRNLYQVSGPAGYPGLQLGAAKIEGSFNAPYADLFVVLTTGVNDDNVELRGYLVGNKYQGAWDWNTGGTSPSHYGLFTASRDNSDPSPPPNPAGTWDYRVDLSPYWYATGLLTFATNSCPITGTWRFSNDFPGVPTQHLFGEGNFTNVTVSGSSLSISIPAGNTAFELKGEMASGIYAGFVQWATNVVPMGFYETGFFWARRK